MRDMRSRSLLDTAQRQVSCVMNDTTSVKTASSSIAFQTMPFAEALPRLMRMLRTCEKLSDSRIVRIGKNVRLCSFQRH